MNVSDYQSTSMGWWGIYPPTTQPCPTCGHCPTCGRGGYMGPWPYHPYQSYPTWVGTPLSGFGTSDSTGTNIHTIRLTATN